jgi:hypothetical protein
MQDERLTPAERELETVLGGLRPAAVPANRDRIMFLAGQASGRRHRRLWQGVSCCLAAAAVILALSRPTSRTTDIGLGPNRTAIAVDDTASATFHLRRTETLTDYVRLRRMVRDRGLDALPPLAPRPSTGQEEPWTRDNLEKILSST